MRQDRVDGMFAFVVKVSLFAYFWAIDPTLERIDDLKQVQFHNQAGKPISISFVPVHDPDRPEFKETVLPGHAGSQDTWVGHVFEVAAEGAIPERFEVVENGHVRCSLDRSGKVIQLEFEWDEPDNRADAYQGPRWDALVEEARTMCLEDLAEYPGDASHFCDESIAFTTTRGSLRSKFDFDEPTWKKAWMEKHAERRQEIWQNPRGMTNFSEQGFAIRAIPASLYEELWDYWRNFRRSDSRPEDHPHLDPNLSGRESDTWVLPIPGEMKELLQRTMRSFIAEWAKIDPDKLVLTAIYGMRLYRKNAKLHMHVDRRETHVLSAILEVGQLGWSQPGLDEGRGHAEDWPLEIMDHHSGVHHVASRPGQMILYESATCPHGRPSKYPGRESANVFVHFRPRGWPDDFKNRDSGAQGEL